MATADRYRAHPINTKSATNGLMVHGYFTVDGSDVVLKTYGRGYVVAKAATGRWTITPDGKFTQFLGGSANVVNAGTVSKPRVIELKGAPASGVITISSIVADGSTETALGDGHAISFVFFVSQSQVDINS